MFKLIFFIILLLRISLSFSSCVVDENHCTKCNPITKLCIKCDKDIYTPDKKGGCEYSHKCLLGKNNCQECNNEGNLCKICIKGYFPDENGGCSYTDNCEISYKGKCLKCKEDFILIGEEKENYEKEKEIKICKSLYFGELKNCEEINISTGLCEKCKEGFFLNEGDKNCISTENCYESIFDVCTKCNKYYYLDKKESKCKKQTNNFDGCQESLDGIICDICEEGYYFDENKNCLDVNYCSKGKNGFICEECIPGYFLSNYQNYYFCTTTEHCYFGDKDLGLCNLCIDGYYIDFKDGKCKSNKEDNDFKYCKKADGACIECLEDYVLGQDNKCSTTKYCAESINGKCIQCIDEHYLGLDNVCTNVEHCIYSNGYFCTECEDNYYYDFSEKKCQKDDGIFKNCRTGYSVANCEDCKVGFYYNQTDRLCYSNQDLDYFYRCKRVSWYGECNYCEDGYYLGGIDNKCSKIEGCDLSENENKCLECDTFYYCLDAKTGKCEISDEIINEDKKFYFRCNKTNNDSTACEECNYGLILDKNGLCVDEKNCFIKNDDGTCKQCGDEKANYCLNNIFGCVRILGYSYCLECNNIFDFYNCTKCYVGYYLKINGDCYANS